MDYQPKFNKGYSIGDAAVYSKNSQVKPSDLAALQCPLCELVLRDPVQVINCGHRFCKGCLEVVTSASTGPLKCPVDGEEFELNEIRSDKGCYKEIQGLLVDCPTKPLPCSWRGPLMDVEDHLQQCPHRKVACAFGCGAQFLISEKEGHENECQKRLTNCIHCGTSVHHDSLEDHYISCQGYPVSCTYCKKNFSRRKEMTDHLENECTEYDMVCPNEKFGGCTFKGKRVQMVQHVQESHMIQSMEKIVSLQQDLSETKSVNRQLMNIVEEQRAAINTLSERLIRVENFIHTGADIPDRVEADRPGAAPTATPKNESLTLLGSPSAKSRPIPVAGASLSKLYDDVEAQTLKLMRVTENVQSLQETATRHSIAVDELRLRQDVLDVKTTNGLLVWKIPEIRRRYRDAVERRTISLYSPPFYTSPHGYRMCIRVYLNGDGAGKGTHISVFFVLMRSEHDNLLTWPFKQTVRFTLINQVIPEASISEAFVPDLQSPSFQKPNGDMNIASGFPRFAKQTILKDDKFTLENAIFIKAQVTLSGLDSH